MLRCCFPCRIQIRPKSPSDKPPALETRHGSSAIISTRGWISSNSQNLMSVAKKRVMVAGLRSSGKTSLLVKMQAWNYLYDNADALPRPPPTKLIQQFSFDLGHLETEFVEVPSSLFAMTSRPVQELLVGVDAVIYLIDSSNPIRLQQAQSQLKDLIRNGWATNKLLVVFTKTDHPKAMTNAELIDAMFPYVKDASDFTFNRICLTSTTRAVNVIREFMKELPRNISAA